MGPAIMEPVSRICGQELASGTCKEMAAVNKLEQFSDGKLSAIHYVIRCPKCGTHVEIERLAPAVKIIALHMSHQVMPFPTCLGKPRV